MQTSYAVAELVIKARSVTAAEAQADKMIDEGEMETIDFNPVEGSFQVGSVEPIRKRKIKKRKCHA